MGKKRRSLLSWAVSLALLLVLVRAGGPPSAMGAEKVVFNLEWLAYALHSGFWAAKEKGLYKESGLDVEILRGYGSGDTVKRIHVGSAQYGIVDAGTLIVARGRGVKAKAIGVLFSRAPYSIMTLEGSGIAKPKDLEGRSVGSPPGNANLVLLPALAAVNGIDLGKVKVVHMTADAMGSSLFAGAIDSFLDYHTALPVYQEKAVKQGKRIRPVLYADHGIQMYSNGLAASDGRIQSNPDQVRRFVGASIRGVAWAVENPDAAMRLLARVRPEINIETQGQMWRLIIRDHLLSEESRAHGIGYMTREKMKTTRDTVAKYMKLESPVEVGDVYTNEFLPGVKPPAGSTK
ncbi:MAG: ABC transporter substrate-binding protein [Candidatus Tectomicrobia bacterium]|nr:ABC transporter substrate-binding protein [Candidatus Tectomicrobia bacterium]